MLKLLGAELVLTPAAQGMRGAVAQAEELLRVTKNAVMPQQFKHPANPDIHRRTTAEEIWNDTGGEIDYFVAGVGTGGTIPASARLSNRGSARCASSPSNRRTVRCFPAAGPGRTASRESAQAYPRHSRSLGHRRGDHDR